MCEEKGIISLTYGERKAAMSWLRGALSTTLEVTAVSQWVKRPTQRAIAKAPDWVLATWADATNLDFVNGYRACPEIASVMSSDMGRATVQQYVEAHDATVTVNDLGALVRTVLNLWGKGTLPIDKETVQRQVFALAMASFMPDAEQFAQAARAVLSDVDHPDHLLVDYRIALEQGDKQKLRALNGALKSTAYDVWVAERLTEARRWLGVEPPHFNIIYGERTLQWDSLWGNIVKGGN